MKYTLRFNEKNELDGYQEIEYDLCGCNVLENHYYNDGVEDNDCSMILLWPKSQTCRRLDACDWGNMEITRDAIEKWVYDQLTCVEVYQDGKARFMVYPFTEGIFVNG